MFDDIELRKCSRIIRPSKYERQSSETFNWWLRLFQVMESEFSIPPYKRMSVVQEIFPDKIFQKILSLMSLVEPARGEQRPSVATVQSRSVRTDRDSKIVLGSVETIIRISEEKPVLPQDRGEAGANNPYIKFFKKNPERVAIWRELPPLSLEEMNLAQKSEAVTTAIAIDFMNWIYKLGGQGTTTLDVPQVVRMFEIGFNKEAATSLKVEMKEMPAVTASIAETRMLPERSTNSMLHKHLRDDVKYFARRPKLLAFGKLLPLHLRYIPPKKDPTARWTKLKTVKHLQSMSAVWDGITDLRSTRQFCQWLIEHPEAPRPKYLNKLGMLESDFFKRPHYSIDTTESMEALADPPPFLSMPGLH